MKRLLLFALLFVPHLAWSQAMTSILAAQVNTGTGPVTGKLCLAAIDAKQAPISISTSDGHFYTKERPFCQTLTAGAMVGSLSVPNPVTDSAPGHGYSITVWNTTTGNRTDVGPAYGIGGTAW